MDKVSSTLQGSESRITSFRHAVRIFKNGESSARDLISTMHSLVGEMDDCAPLVNGLVDLLDDADRSKALAQAWNEYRVERTQFPSLTRPAPAQRRGAFRERDMRGRVAGAATCAASNVLRQPRAVRCGPTSNVLPPPHRVMARANRGAKGTLPVPLHAVVGHAHHPGLAGACGRTRRCQPCCRAAGKVVRRHAVRLLLRHVHATTVRSARPLYL